MEIQKKDPSEILYFRKDSKSAIRFSLAYMQFPENAPKICEFFGIKSIFRQKNGNISKNYEGI